MAAQHYSCKEVIRLAYWILEMVKVQNYNSKGEIYSNEGYNLFKMI